MLRIPQHELQSVRPRRQVDPALRLTGAKMHVLLFGRKRRPWLDRVVGVGLRVLGIRFSFEIEFDYSEVAIRNPCVGSRTDAS